MTLDEVRKLKSQDLVVKAAGLVGWTHCLPMRHGLHVFGYRPGDVPNPLPGEDVNLTWPPRLGTHAVPDYLNDISASWELFQKAKSGPNFWDFCFWLERLAGSTVWTVVMGHLSPRMITEAFVLAETNKEEA